VGFSAYRIIRRVRVHDPRVPPHGAGAAAPLPARCGTQYSAGLLLDSRGVDFTRAYHAIFASRPLLEVILFQGPNEGFARFRRTVEQKPLAPHKSPPCKTSSQAAATTSTGSRLALSIVHGWYHSAGASRATAISRYRS